MSENKSAQRQSLATIKRVVIKIGSALLTNDGQGIDENAIAGWVADMAKLRQQGIDVVLVSSGAVAAGIKQLNWSQRPTDIAKLQAAAAVGQVSLLHCYQTLFTQHDLCSAQVLLVHDDIADRRRYLNARNTINTLLEEQLIPIVNENDTVATDEIRFGDNDTLAAMVANIIDAELLIILTDQDAMYDADPRSHANAQKITIAAADDKSLITMAGGGGEFGRGGMLTKVKAAQTAARSGADTIIVGGRIDDVLPRLFADEDLGTYLYAPTKPLEARKLWLAGLVANTDASLELDAGAVNALQKGGASVLAVGVNNISGSFNKGDMINCVDAVGKIIAKGLIDYKSEDCAKIIGKHSSEFFEHLGFQGADALIHCDNLVLL